jgi:hypothetical protein
LMYPRTCAPVTVWCQNVDWMPRSVESHYASLSTKRRIMWSMLPPL